MWGVAILERIRQQLSDIYRMHIDDKSALRQLPSLDPAKS